MSRIADFFERLEIRKLAYDARVDAYFLELERNINKLIRKIRWKLGCGY